jgi:hypothetical protein
VFAKHNTQQFQAYNAARSHFVAHPEQLIALEQYFIDYLASLLVAHASEIRLDYDEASYLYPFWQRYPPDDRGNQPKQDQYPWIEVGEHAIGSKLARLFGQDFKMRDAGLPTGSDQRFLLEHDEIRKITKGQTNQVWLFIDIKSAGPRDEQDHAVMSHNQVSGDGLWTQVSSGVTNKVMKAVGTRASHDFHCSMPPIYVPSNLKPAPAIVLALKPIYTMLPPALGNTRNDGQPLKKIVLATIPNGLLLTTNPNYLQRFPGLLFPGKDDKSKNPKKLRARISFPLLLGIADWRVQDVVIP